MEWHRFVTYLWNDPRNNSVLLEQRECLSATFTIAIKAQCYLSLNVITTRTTYR